MMMMMMPFLVELTILEMVLANRFWEERCKGSARNNDVEEMKRDANVNIIQAAKELSHKSGRARASAAIASVNLDRVWKESF